MSATWPVLTLGEIFLIARGGSPRPIDQFFTDDPGGVNWVLISDATDSSKYISSTKKRIRQAGVSRSRVVHPGDFLLTNSMSFGRPYIMNTTGCIHDGWLVLSDRHGRVNSDYFYHLLGSDAIYSEFERLAPGATVKNLNIDLVSGVRVPLPPLPEQQRIAKVLDAADALRAKWRVALAELGTLSHSIFLDMFGVTGVHKAGASTVVVEDITSVVTKGTTPSSLGLPMSDSGVPFLRVQNLRNGCVDLSIEPLFIPPLTHAQLARSVIRPRDVLVSIAGTIGRAALVDDHLPEMNCNQAVAILRPNHRVVGRFLLAWLQGAAQQQITSAEVTGTITNLSLSQIRAMRLDLPPVPVQQTFARRVAAVEKLMATHRASLAEMDALFASLQHRAFRGEL